MLPRIKPITQQYPDNNWTDNQGKRGVARHGGQRETYVIIIQTTRVKDLSATQGESLVDRHFNSREGDGDGDGDESGEVWRRRLLVVSPM